MKYEKSFYAFVLALTLSTCGWVGLKTVESTRDIAVLSRQALDNHEQHKAMIAGLEKLQDTMIPRREYDARMAQIDVRLREIDLEILKLKQKIP